MTLNFLLLCKDTNRFLVLKNNFSLKNETNTRTKIKTKVYL